MTNSNLEKKIIELKEMKAMKKDVEAEITRLEDELKHEMTQRNTNDLCVGIHHLTYKSVTSKRFDSKALRASDEDLYNRFLKVTECMRFTVA